MLATWHSLHNRWLFVFFSFCTAHRSHDALVLYFLLNTVAIIHTGQPEPGALDYNSCITITMWPAQMKYITTRKSLSTCNIWLCLKCDFILNYKTRTTSLMLTDMPLHPCHIESGNIAQSQTVTWWCIQWNLNYCAPRTGTRSQYVVESYLLKGNSQRTVSVVFCYLNVYHIEFYCSCQHYELLVTLPPNMISEDCAVTTLATCQNYKEELCFLWSIFYKHLKCTVSHGTQ